MGPAVRGKPVRFRLRHITDRIFEITFLDPEVQAYPFTFG
jgi:hypothetical protein